MTNYTMNADAAIFAVDGPTSLIDYGVQGDKATFSLAGQIAALQRGRLLVAAGATYTLTANIAALIATPNGLAANTATMLVTASDAVMLHNIPIAFARATFGMTAYPASLVYAAGPTPPPDDGMTTSANRPVSIITDAYFDAGLLQEGQTLNSEQLVRGMRILTDLINLWQTQDGLKLWLNHDLSITLTPGTGLYTLGRTGTVAMNKPLRALGAYWLSAAGIRRPLAALSWDDYIRLGQINQAGTINSYFINKQKNTLNVFFWQPPDAIDAMGTAHLLLQQQVQNFTNLSEEMDFPIEWRMALRWGLADDICTGQPQAIMDRCALRAAQYYKILSDWDVEDASTYITADNHGKPGSKFS